MHVRFMKVAGVEGTQNGSHSNLVAISPINEEIAK